MELAQINISLLQLRCYLLYSVEFNLKKNKIKKKKVYKLFAFVY